MSRLSKYLLISVLVIFVLACNLVTGPIDDVQNLAKTAEALGTAMPIETIQALASAIPVETLEALPSAFPELGNVLDPQGTPLAEWNGIPIMAQATAGQEQDASSYSFKASVTVLEAKDFYDDQMSSLGWSPNISMSGNANGALLVFSKDGSTLTITITAVEDATVVILALV